MLLDSTKTMSSCDQFSWLKKEIFTEFKFEILLSQLIFSINYKNHTLEIQFWLVFLITEIDCYMECTN